MMRHPAMRAWICSALLTLSVCFNSQVSKASDSYTWQSISFSGGPAGRFGHTAVWDSRRNRMLVYGGELQDGSYSGELWAWTPATSTWSQLSSSSSADLKRTEHCAVYDSLSDKMIIFLGKTASTGHPEKVYAFDCADGSPSEVTIFANNDIPCPRQGSAAAWDPHNRKIYVSGGTVLSNSAELGDAYSLEPEDSNWGDAEWYMLSPSNCVSNRTDCSQIIYGSTQCDAAHCYPDPRSDHLSVFDRVRERTFVLSGFYAINCASGAQSWSFSGNTYTSPMVRWADGPGGERMAGAINPGAYGKVLYFGGTATSDCTPALNDTYVHSMDLSANPTTGSPSTCRTGSVPSWGTESTSGTGPTARRDHTMVFDPTSARMIVFGGMGASVPSNELFYLSEDNLVPAISDEDPLMTNHSVVVVYYMPSYNSSTRAPTETDLRYSSSPITEANWGSATAVAGEPSPGSPGATQSKTVSGLASSHLYYFAMKERYVGGQYSALSNVWAVTTPGSGGFSHNTDVAAVPFSVNWISGNPVMETAEWRVSGVTSASAIRADVYDVAGRSVRRLDAMPGDGGSWRLRWDVSGFDGERVSPGVYFLRVITSVGRKVLPVIVTS